jgi:hypothetical protein
MTINRGWIEIFKRTSQRSFSTNLPPDHGLKTAFIDGQLKLQRPGDIVLWHHWMQVQFMCNIRRYLRYDDKDKNGDVVDDSDKEMTVVLAFDNHLHSPAAKAPTQQKRKSRVVAAEWDESMKLPGTIPETYERLLYNRTFKAAVITKVIKAVIEEFQPTLKGKQRIIIDYQGDPYIITAGVNSVRHNLHMTVPLGESDVKFVRYLNMGNLLLDAVDSDYVIIAMNQIERLQNTQPHAVPNIYVRRLLVDLDPTGKRKRKAAGATAAAAAAAAVATAAATGSTYPKKTPRQYEFIHINSVTVAMQNKLGLLDERMQRMNNSASALSNNVSLLPNTIKLFTTLVAMCGCDFTRGIPWFGPATMWKNIDIIWWGVRRASLADGACDWHALNPRAVAEYIVAPMWRNVLYKNHAKSAQKLYRENVQADFTFEKTYAELSASTTISQRVKESLMTEATLSCLVKNVNWVTIYWRYPEQCPDAVNVRFGFVRNEKGLVRFDAAATLEDAYY